MLYRFAKNAASAAEAVTEDEERLFFVCAACEVSTTNQQRILDAEVKMAVSATSYGR